MAIFAIADLHLSESENVDKPMDIFGSGWADHAARVAKNWREAVSAEDTVIVAGDISWAMSLDDAMADLGWLSELPGRKLLVRGNHDYWWSSLKKMRERAETLGIEFIQNDFRALGETAVCGTRGWICPGSGEFSEHDRKIYERELLRLEMSLSEAKKAGCRDIIAALHYPPTNEKYEPSGFTELLEKYGVSDAVYGHLHGAGMWQRGLQGERGGVRYHLISLDYMNCELLKLR